jgi:hypothetical protein
VKHHPAVPREATTGFVLCQPLKIFAHVKIQSENCFFGVIVLEWQPSMFSQASLSFSISENGYSQTKRKAIRFVD